MFARVVVIEHQVFVFLAIVTLLTCCCMCCCDPAFAQDADDADAEAARAQDAAAAETPAQRLRRNTSLGSIDMFGVYKRDDDASNPLFDGHEKAGVTKRLAGGMASAVGLKKKRNSKAEKEMVRATLRVAVYLLKK